MKIRGTPQWLYVDNGMISEGQDWKQRDEEWTEEDEDLN